MIFHKAYTHNSTIPCINFINYIVPYIAILNIIYTQSILDIISEQ